jgi:ArsR family transcriptional regulator
VSSQCCAPREMPKSGDELEDLATVKAVLSDPAKLELVEHLERIGPCINQLPLGHVQSSSSLLEHLRALNAVGVVQGVFEGPRLCFCINQQTMAKVRSVANKDAEIRPSP